MIIGSILKMRVDGILKMGIQQNEEEIKRKMKREENTIAIF
jgi:hypothetical protein